MGRKRLDYTKILTEKERNNLSHSVARKYAAHHNLPKGYITPVREDNPPICRTDACSNPQVPLQHHWFTGMPMYRGICQCCHEQKTAGKHGLKSIAQVVAKNAGFKSVSDYMNHLAVQEGYESLYDKLNQQAISEGFESYIDKLNQQAIAEGYKSLTHKKNMKHPYLRYRKEYCENIDGRLGNVCTTTIVWEGQLDVDHIDGNSKNNKEENLQTLCKCCHAYKTNLYKDYKTIGRTKIKELEKQGLLTSLISEGELANIT